MFWDVIIWVIMFALSFVYMFKGYKECKDILDKILFISIYFVAFLPLIIFYLDKYNIPTLLRWANGVNTQNWLSFFSSYFSSIVGAIISAVVLIIVTVKQMDRTFKENQERDREERRINNMPLLEYKFNTINSSLKNSHTFATLFNSGLVCKINFFIRNIGMNSVKKCYININSNEFIKEETIEIDSQSCIYKEDEKKIKLIMVLEEGHYVLNLTVYYVDLLDNWYKQKIVLEFDVFESYFINIDNLIFRVESEKRLKRPPSNIGQL